MKTLQISKSINEDPERFEECSLTHKLKSKCKVCQTLTRGERNSLETCSCNDNLCDCCGKGFPYVIPLSWDNSRVCNDCARWECCMNCKSWCGSNICKECRKDFS